MLPLCIFTANAQITVTDADMGSVGSTIEILNDTTVTGLSVGNASTTISFWNFTSLQIDTKDTLEFVSPVGTPGAALFPSTNVAIYDGENYTYVKKTASELAVDGTFGDFLNLGISVPADLKPDLKLMEFPATLGTSFSGVSVLDSTVLNTFGLPLFDSLRVKRITDYSSDIDAYGTLNTPSGTYNTLREYRVETAVDSLWGYSTFTGWSLVSNTVETTHMYKWIANGEEYYVMEAVADGQDGNMLSASYQVGSNLISNASSTDITCNGDNDGTAIVNPIGGVAPYTYIWSNGETTASIDNLAAATYTVTVNDANSAVSVSTVVVTEPAVITITEDNVTDEIFGTDGSIDISVAGGVSPYTYVWSNGETTQDISGLATGSYSVTVTDANGCVADLTSGVADLTSVDEVAKNNVKLYPVPTNGVINISSQNTISSVEVVDLSGRVILSKDGNQQQLDLSSYSEGIYIIRIETGKELILEKIQLVK